MAKIIRNENILLFCLFLLGILSRLPLIEKMQSHWDGPDYTLALIRYSFEQQTPSPPGYPIYIGIGKFFYLFTTDPHLAIVLVSVLFGGIGAVVFYIAGKTIFSSTVGLINSFLFLSAPTIYYFGITANPYGLLSTTSVSLATVVFLIVFNRLKNGLLLGLVFSIAIGIRPQDAMFLILLFLFGFIWLDFKEKVITVIVFIFSFLLWFIPTIFAVGGVHNYVKYIIEFSQQDAEPQFTLLRLESIWLILLKGFFLTVGISGIFLLYYGKKIFYFLIHPQKISRKNLLFILFFSLWVIPSLLFNMFVRSDHAAHQMTYLSSLILLIAYAIYAITKGKLRYLVSIVIIIVVFNLITFFRDRDIGDKKPYVSQSYHYSELVKNNIRLAAINTYIINNYPPSSTIILVDPEIFRPVMYYEKNYVIYSYSSMDAVNSPYINNVHFGFNWNYQILVNKQHFLKVPKKITTIICIPNNKLYTFTVDNVEKKTLNGNAFIYVIKTKTGQRLLISYHNIEKQTNY